MSRLRIFILLGFAVWSTSLLKAQTHDQQPDSAHWTTQGGISFQVVCLTDPKKVGDMEPDTGALLRVYFLNKRDHVVYNLVTNTDGGFQISATSASGQILPLHTKPPTGVSRISLKPNKIESFTYPLTQKKWDFLKGMPMTISTRIYDPNTQSMLTLEAPVELAAEK